MLSYLFLFFCFLFLLRNLRSHFHFFSLSFTLLHLTTLLFSIPFHLLIHLRCEKVTNWSVIKKKIQRGKQKKRERKREMCAERSEWEKWQKQVRTRKNRVKNHGICQLKNGEKMQRKRQKREKNENSKRRCEKTLGVKDI